VTVEARLLDDHADARERRGPLGRHRPPEQPHRAGIGEAEQHPDQGRVAGAVRAEMAKGGAAGGV